MDAELEAALCDAIERSRSGAPVTQGWLRRRHPGRWRAVQECLELDARLRDGRPPRRTVGAYRLLRRLGEGGMGTVYLAVALDPSAGVPAGAEVALKVIHERVASMPGFARRVACEAAIGRAVRHRNVARVLGSGVARHAAGADVFIVSEHVEGRNLRGIARELGAVPEALCRHVARETLAGLVAIHAAGVVHRDLKPENLIATRSGVLKITDLGAARRPVELDPADDDAMFHGSVPYAAPEQLARRRVRVDGRADLYALGVMLRELLTGRPPSRAAARRRTPAAGFFAAFVATLAAPDPDERFASAREALGVLDAGEASSWWRSAGRLATAGRAAAPRSWPPRPRLVGRAAELRALRRAWGAARSGDARALLVTGEAGIGKSRLAGEFVDALERSGAAVAVVTAPRRPHGIAAAVGAALGGAAAPPAPRLADPALAASALAARLSAASARAPLAVLADDLHAADADELALFRGLAASLAGSVLLVGTARDGAMGRELPRLRLRPLPPAALERLVRAAVGSSDAASRVLRHVAPRAGGNPGFALEIVAKLRDEARLEPAADGSWRFVERPGAVAVPGSVAALVAERLASLDAEERRVLAAAACCGLVFDAAVVAEALGREPLPVLQTLAALDRTHGLVRSAGGLHEFARRIVRDALEERLDGETRAALRLAIGTALESRLRGDIPPARRHEVAAHFLAAGRGDRAAPHFAAALRFAEGELHATDALAFADAAIAASVHLPGGERAAAVLSRARSLALLGRTDEEIATLEGAVRDAAGDARRLADARTALAGALLRAGRRADAAAEARRALGAAEHDGDETRVERLHGVLGEASLLGGETDAARVHFETAVALAERSGDARRRAAAQSGLTSIFTRQGLPEATRASAQREVELLEGCGATEAELRGARGNLASSLMQTGRFAEAIPHFEKLAAAARERGDVAAESSALGETASAVALTRSLREATEMQRRAVELAGAAGAPSFLLMTRHRFAGLLLRVGQTDEALVVCDRIAAGARAARSVPASVNTRILRAQILRTIGESAAARRAAGAAARIARRHGFARELRAARYVLAVADEARADVAALREYVQACREARELTGLVLPLQELGRAIASSGDAVGARSAYEDAARLAREFGLHGQSAACAVHLAALGAGDAGDAARGLARHVETLAVRQRVELYHALGSTLRDVELLRAAAAALDTLRDGAPLASRESMLRNVPLFAAVTESRRCEELRR